MDKQSNIIKLKNYDYFYIRTFWYLIVRSFFYKIWLTLNPHLPGKGKWGGIEIAYKNLFVIFLGG